MHFEQPFSILAPRNGKSFEHGIRYLYLNYDHADKNIKEDQCKCTINIQWVKMQI